MSEIRMPDVLMKEIVTHAEYLRETIRELQRWEAMLLPLDATVGEAKEGVATSLSRHVSDILRISNQSLERDEQSIEQEAIRRSHGS